MEASFPVPDVVRPWRRATIVASSVAALELVLLVGAGAFLLAKPLSRALHSHAVAAAKAPAAKHTASPVVHRQVQVVAKPKLTRAQTKVLVLNGNGENGAAHTEAAKLTALGYRISGAANAKRQDYATTVVMYSPGYAPEGERLAQDVGAKVIGPLDGVTPAALHGGELAIVLGAS
jgi:LytR cell envelope-related transcriptional attenuator